MGEKRNAFRILVGKPEGKRSLGRPRCWWLDNVKMDLRERGWAGFIWLRIGPAEGYCEYLNEPPGSVNIGKFLSRYTTGGSSRRAQFHEVSQSLS
jgi:hypothetical protein